MRYKLSCERKLVGKKKSGRDSRLGVSRNLSGSIININYSILHNINYRLLKRISGQLAD
jgi:hypothetical protein